MPQKVMRLPLQSPVARIALLVIFLYVFSIPGFGLSVKFCTQPVTVTQPEARYVKVRGFLAGAVISGATVDAG